MTSPFYEYPATARRGWNEPQGFPFLFFVQDARIIDFEEVRAWCVDNFGVAGRDAVWYEEWGWFWFRTHIEATAFKIRWV